jgi:monoamine oxidase
VLYSVANPGIVTGQTARICKGRTGPICLTGKRRSGRIVLAGEHASYLGAWQEGAVTSAIDAITRLHQRATAA